MPVLGLIFLRHAATRFHALLPDMEQAIPARAAGALREDRIRLGFQVTNTKGEIQTLRRGHSLSLHDAGVSVAPGVA